MAVRFAGTTDQLSRSGSLPGSTGGITATFWVYLSVDLNAATCLTRLSQTGTSILYLSTDADGTSVAWFSSAGSIVTTFQLTVGAWHRIAATHNAGAGTLYTATATGATNVDTGTIVTGTPDLLGIGGRGSGDNTEPFNGRLAAYKLYSAVLTQAEIEAEWTQYRPIRTASLHSIYPFVNAELVDYSGNGRTLTAGSTATTTEAGPPIRWDGRLRGQLILPAAAGTVGAVTATTTAAASAGATRSDTAALSRVTTASSTVTATRSDSAAVAVGTVAGSSVTAARSDTAATTAVIAAAGAVSAARSDSGALTAATTVGASVSAAVGATGQVAAGSSPTTAVTGSRSDTAAVAATTTAGTVVTGATGAAAAGIVTAAAVVAASASSPAVVTATTIPSSTVTGARGDTGAVTTTTTAASSVTATRSDTAATTVVTLSGATVTASATLPAAAVTATIASAAFVTAVRSDLAQVVAGSVAGWALTATDTAHPVQYPNRPGTPVPVPGPHAGTPTPV